MSGNIFEIEIKRGLEFKSSLHKYETFNRFILQGMVVLLPAEF